MGMEPFRLKPFFSERVWGKKSLAPWFASTGTEELVGEAWLTGPQSTVETGPHAGERLDAVIAAEGAAVLGEGSGEAAFPLLVKILFPADKLSVQVHPDDVQAQAIGEPRGKTECWYVLEAEPGAAVALGLKDGVTLEDVRAAIADGTLEEKLEMVPVRVGDMLFVDAGTVHAIGPGVVLLETQQTSDRTYRMFDYGRPRELHVEQGVRVTKLKTRAGKVAPRVMDGFTRLIEEQYFSVDHFELKDGGVAVTMDGPGCLVGLSGSAVVRSNAEEVELRKASAVVVPAGSEVRVEALGAGVSFARCMAPR
jgi:mannose-6-phosphate isomerase